MNSRITAAILLAITAIAIPTAASAQTFVPGLGQGGGNESSLPTSQLEFNRQKANDGAFVGSIAGGAGGLLVGYLVGRGVCESSNGGEACGRAVIVGTAMPLLGAAGGGLIGRNMVRDGQELNAEYRPVWEGLGIGLGAGIATLAIMPTEVFSEPIIPLTVVVGGAAGGAIVGFLNPLEGNANNFTLAPMVDHKGRMGFAMSGRF